MAKDLNINKCWYHSKPYAHYDIPKRRIKEIQNKTQIITSKQLLKICKGYTIMENYLEDSARSMATQTEDQRQIEGYNLCVIEQMSTFGSLADMLKRSIFYQDSKAGERYQKHMREVSRKLYDATPKDKEIKTLTQPQMDLFHSLLGLMSELGEVAEAYAESILFDKELDSVNMKEEVGDMAWYLAIPLRQINVSFEECLVTNISKLKARFPDKFNFDDAVNRDLDNERKVLNNK